MYLKSDKITGWIDNVMTLGFIVVNRTMTLAKYAVSDRSRNLKGDAAVHGRDLIITSYQTRYC